MSVENLFKNNNSSEPLVYIEQTPHNIKQVWEKLEELAQIKDNWDSYGGISPTKPAMLGSAQIAYEILQDNTPTPDIFPVPNGHIQFEWSCFNLDIEIEIESRRRCYVTFEDLESGINWEKEFTYDLTELSQIIADLTQRSEEDDRTRTVN